MSYVQIPIGIKTVYKEARLISVTAGVAAPTPATGYSISAKLYTEYGRDWYLEYKEVEGALVSV